MTQSMYRGVPALGTAILFSALCVTGLSGCNKLGYGDPRTAPKGQASLGPKRTPVLNGPELQKQKKATVKPSSISQSVVGTQQPPMQSQAMTQPQSQPMMSAPMMSAPVPAPTAMYPGAPMNPPVQVPSLQQMQQPQPQSRPLAQPMRLPNLPRNYPVTQMPNPYHNSPQNYQMPDRRSQHYTPQQHMQAQVSSYPLPHEYPADSYHIASPTAGVPSSAIGDIAHQVSVGAQKDYYVQDMLENPIAATVASMNPQAQWYTPSAPVGQVSDYPAGATSYTQAEPEYDNVFYGGQGMPRDQVQQPANMNVPPEYAPATTMMSPPMTNGYSQRAGGMINPVSQRRYLEEEARRPLEVPPMLDHANELPNPNGQPSLMYYEGY